MRNLEVPTNFRADAPSALDASGIRKAVGFGPLRF